MFLFFSLAFFGVLNARAHSPRSVVALFNAISKRQNQADGSGGGGGGGTVSKVAGTAKAAAVKGASRHAFLDMLKTGVKPTAEAGAAGGGRRGRGEGEGGDATANGGGGEVRMHAALAAGGVHRPSGIYV